MALWFFVIPTIAILFFVQNSQEILVRMHKNILVQVMAFGKQSFVFSLQNGIIFARSHVIFVVVSLDKGFVGEWVIKLVHGRVLVIIFDFLFHSCF